MKTYSTFISILISVIPFFGLTQYCSPSFGIDVEPISLVQIETINNTTSNTCASGLEVEDFTTQQTSLDAGDTYNISVDGTTCGAYTNHFRVFFDWNQDNDFADANETYYIGTINNTTGGTPISTNIAVPGTANSGVTRMRVVKNYNTDPTNPCGGYDYGQAEDYSITVASAGIATLLNYSEDPLLSTGFAHRRGANINPKFTIEGSEDFNAVQIELNQSSDFTGTALVSTINDGTNYSASTPYDFWTTENLTGDRTYFVRTRISSDGGSNWGEWSTQLWPYSYYPTTTYEEEGWYYTSEEQFLTGVVQEANYDFLSILDNTTAYPDDDYMQVNEGSYSVNTTTNDGVYENGTWYPAPTYMTIGYQNNCNGNDPIYNGFPFTLNIPQDATILTNEFSIVATNACFCETQNIVTPLIFDGHDFDNGPALNGTNVTSLTNRTTAQENIVLNSSWTDNVRYTVLSNTSILQEVVDRAGWNDGNDFNLLARWDNAFTPGSNNNRCLRQRDNGTATSPRLEGTFSDFKNTVYFPTVNRDIYGPDAGAWDELKVTDNTVSCGNCYVEYNIHDAATQAVVAGPFVRNAGLSGSQSFDISSVAQQEIFVSAAIFRNNSPVVHDIWLTATEPSPLPVELIDFNVYCENKTTQVNWETGSERNNDFFTLEKSENGKTWTYLDQVSGQGTTINPIVYEKIYTGLGNTKYIRLSQTNFDGTKTVLGIESIDCKNQEIYIFPNPTSGGVTIQNAPKDASIVLSNMQGQVVMNLKNNDDKTVVDLSNLSSGTYFINIKGKLSTQHFKVVKE